MRAPTYTTATYVSQVVLEAGTQHLAHTIVSAVAHTLMSMHDNAHSLYLEQRLHDDGHDDFEDHGRHQVQERVLYKFEKLTCTRIDPLVSHILTNPLTGQLLIDTSLL